MTSGPSSGQHLTLSGARDLLVSLSHEMAKQQRINQASGQLHGMSFLMNYANAARARALHEDYQLVKRDIHEGKQLLVNIQGQVHEQHQSILDLTDSVVKVAEDVEDQKQKYNDLSGTVDRQREEMQRAMEEYDKKLSGQEAILNHQEQTLTVLTILLMAIHWALIN